MKKRRFSIALIAVMILSGCGAGEKSSDTYVSNGSFMEANTAQTESGGGFMDYDYAEDFNYAFDEAAEAEAPYPEPAESPSSAERSEASSGLSADEIDREMLVYSCSMSIDTLDFTSTVSSFKTLLDQYGGFIESENYDDGGSYGRWYSEAAEKWQSYSATLRVPSRNYDAFCSSAGTLGDLRSKNASVQNLSSEYHDLSTSLEIYEAKEERYISLLATITEDEYAVAIERELTDLQIEIARIKSRMNKINTDVSYSYVYITINEVKEYVSEPVKTDTFFDRLLNTIRNTWTDFVGFWEALLFLIIRLLPYLVLIALLIIIIIALTKKRRARRRTLRQEGAAQIPQSAQAVQATTSAEQTPQTLAQAGQTVQTAAPAEQAPQTTASTTQTAQTSSDIQPVSDNSEQPTETK